MLKGMFLLKILNQNLRENPGIGGHFEFMQIKTLKLRHMKHCANQSILGNNILNIQSAPNVC